MKLKVNGKEIDFTGETVHDLVSLYNLLNVNIVVERNSVIVHREEYMQTKLSENDVIELVRFVGGG